MLLNLCCKLLSQQFSLIGECFTHYSIYCYPVPHFPSLSSFFPCPLFLIFFCCLSFLLLFSTSFLSCHPSFPPLLSLPLPQIFPISVYYHCNEMYTRLSVHWQPFSSTHLPISSLKHLKFKCRNRT